MRQLGKQALLRTLLISLVLSIFSGCSGGTENAKEETSAASPAQTQAAPTADADSVDNEEVEEIPVYPYETVDLGGRDFTFLNVDDNLWQGTFHVLDYEEESVEPVNDALFRRARGTEEEFNCVIKVEKPSNDIGQVYQTLGRAVTAGDDIYDTAFVGLASFGDALSGKYGVNLLDIDSLHMDAPWWNRMFVEDMTLEGFGNLGGHPGRRAEKQNNTAVRASS